MLKHSFRIGAVVLVLAVAGIVAAIVISDRSATARQSNLPMDKRYVSANCTFGFHLLRALAGESKGKNVFISPASVALALSMTYNGASGDTQSAMAGALAIKGMSLEELNKAAAALLSNLQQPGEGVQLSVANSLWARNGVTFDPAFMDRNREFYEAEVTNLDFSDRGSVDRINGWVSDKTAAKIDRIISEIPSGAIMFLVNAVYFKGAWTDKFDPKSTQDQPFKLSNGEKKPVPMMYRSDEVGYLAGKGFSAVRLPYGKGRISLYVFLPDEKADLSAFIAKLDAKAWSEWMKGFKSREVQLSIPKFKLECSFELKPALSTMGMGVAFDNRASFSKMVPGAGPGDVFIGSVKHKTFVDVNEEGTEAAAATSVEMAATCAPPAATQFIVDRPFFCAIRDDKTGEILFAGAIQDPLQK